MCWLGSRLPDFSKASANAVLSMAWKICHMNHELPLVFLQLPLWKLFLWQLDYEYAHSGVVLCLHSHSLCLVILPLSWSWQFPVCSFWPLSLNRQFSDWLHHALFCWKRPWEMLSISPVSSYASQQKQTCSWLILSSQLQHMHCKISEYLMAEHLWKASRYLTGLPVIIQQWQYQMGQHQR